MLLDFQRATNLVQIKTPTRIANKSSSLIDLIFVSPSILRSITASSTIEYNVSDHDIIFLIYKKETITKEKVTFTYRSLKNFNLALLLHRLDTTDWGDFFAANNPNDCWNILYQKYLSILNSIAPFITKTNVPAKDDWLDNNCLAEIKKRDDLRQKIKYTDDKLTRQEYNKARNSARQATNTARSTFVKRDIAENEKSPCKFWDRLKILMPGKKDKSSSASHISLSDSDGNPLEDNGQMANLANNFFINVGAQLAAKIKTNNTMYINNLALYIKAGTPIHDFDPINETKLLRLVKKIDTSKASNIPGINRFRKGFRHNRSHNPAQKTTISGFKWFSTFIINNLSH